MTTKRLALGSFFCVSAAFAAGCGESGLAYGDPNSVIAVMPEDLWFEVSEDVYDALETTIVTVRDEKKFTVTFQEPYAENWSNLRKFRQLLIVGSTGDAWIQEVFRDTRDPLTELGVHQVRDIWSSGQVVTLVLLPDGWGRSDLAPYLPEVGELLDGQYRRYAQNRMFMSGVDSALADTLSTEQGFLLYLPRVYRWQSEDDVFVFRNDNPDPSELIREIVVTWVSPAPVSVGTEELLEWRERVVSEHYSEDQDVVLDGLQERSFVLEGNSVQQIQAQWRNPPERGWPAGGPFITRAVTCDSQDRTYLIDAWLYAPGKEKYEYMIQLETILDTFECSS